MGSDWVLIDDPDGADAEQIHEQDITDSRCNRESEMPTVGETDCIRRPTVKEYQTKKEHKERASKIDEAFEAFWQVYPQKIAKNAARREFIKAVNAGHDPQAIIEGARRYAAWLGHPNGWRPQAKNANGWLNEERWQDPELWASEQAEDPEVAAYRARMRRIIEEAEAANRGVQR